MLRPPSSEVLCNLAHFAVQLPKLLLCTQAGHGCSVLWPLSCSQSMPVLVLWHFVFRHRQLAQDGQSTAILNTNNLSRYLHPPGGTMSVYPVVFIGVAQLGEFSSMVLCSHAQKDDSMCSCLVCLDVNINILLAK